MKVVILRGLPGSGKSTWVKTNAPEAVVCSADAYLYEPDGTYNWTPERLRLAHFNCQDNFLLSLGARVPLIVVDNCNLTARDLRFYVEAAEDQGYGIEIRTLRTDPKVAQARCLHGVPAEKYPLLAQRLSNPLPEAWQKYEVDP